MTVTPVVNSSFLSTIGAISDADDKREPRRSRESKKDRKGKSKAKEGPFYDIYLDGTTGCRVWFLAVTDCVSVVFSRGLVTACTGEGTVEMRWLKNMPLVFPLATHWVGASAQV